ncbi:NAD-dependent epimerase/dehydratase family protein [Cohnella zeiphila]|uniref:NAD(P)-dependent oxidoreductase n=1 Tax=Cohnella zeiphila TaxID=2761120 RepID=A0A7X0SMD1_9BACL|nr:NAD(P)-dependent oxidoreductase [Cohnella zeiphila]MBB6730413.1 NAD(P)-dependent oxidoreductase [Cohnella zeiphila]
MILITGGMGFIGLHAAQALLDEGEDVVLTRYREHRLPPSLFPQLDRKLFVEQVDIAEPDALLTAGRKYGVSGILHLASPPMLGPAAGSIRSQVAGLLNVLEAGSALNVRRVVLASSIAVYAGADGALWREDVPLPLESPYPMTAYKKLTEIIGSFCSGAMSLDTVSVRFSAYGPLARGLHFLPAQAVLAAVRGKPLSAFVRGGIDALPYAEDGIDFAYVKDVAAALARLLAAPSLRHRVYNIGSGRIVPNREIAEAARRAVPGAGLELRPGRSGEAIYPALDIARLREELGWSPRYTIEQGIAEYADWLRQGNAF